MFNKLLLLSLAVHEIVFVKFCGRVFSYVTCLNFFHVSHFVHLWKVMNMGILCEKAVAWSKGVVGSNLIWHWHRDACYSYRYFWCFYFLGADIILFLFLFQLDEWF